ncbi:10339_t:CDS:1 [Gigaspora rosea]|nr:10339_t:CDS:1 [Gigaspora rosea]
MNTTAVIQIYIDLSTINLSVNDIPTYPYSPEHSLVQIATLVYRRIVDALEEENRIESLVHAFYLGEMINRSPRREVHKLKRIIPRYYTDAAIRTHLLFEHHGVGQLYCTNWTTLSKIRNLSRSEFEELLP